MGNNIYGQYLDAVHNKGIYLTVFVALDVLVCMSCNFQATFLPPSTWGYNEK